MMNLTTMRTASIIALTLMGLGCFDPGWSGDGYDDSPSGPYHADSTVRQSLTAPAPGLDPSGPGYAVDEDGYGYSYDCQVHAECGPNELCAADPACPEYTYCYALDSSEADGCNCADRYYTVCYEGECVLRGTDCAMGCPEEAGYVCGVDGLCVCVDEQCEGWDPPADATPRPQPATTSGSCYADSDCPEGCYCEEGQCVEGERETAPRPAPVDCASDDHCDRGFLCDQGDCVEMGAPFCRHDGHCDEGSPCVDGECVAPGTRPVADDCTTHSQCKTAYCGNGKCRQLCVANEDCGDWECQEPPSLEDSSETACWSPRCGNCGEFEYCTADGECVYAY